MSVLIRHGPRTGHEVALTFDMGGRVGDALAIVRWLVDRGVHATIFMTGAAADSTAGREVLAIVDANPAQLRIGNHTYTHRDLRDLTPADGVREHAAFIGCRDGLADGPVDGCADTDPQSAGGSATHTSAHASGHRAADPASDRDAVAIEHRHPAWLADGP